MLTEGDLYRRHKHYKM